MNNTGRDASRQELTGTEWERIAASEQFHDLLAIKKVFMSDCASCHGKDAQGDGPAASALKIAPADLTALAKQNGGTYPAMKVTSVLSSQTDLAAHGNKEMPVWGKVFWRTSGGHEAEVQQRVANLNH